MYASVTYAIIVSDNGLSPSRRQAIIWINAWISLIEPLGANFSEVVIEIHIFSFKNAFERVVWKMAVILSRPECVNLLPHRIFIVQWLLGVIGWLIPFGNSHLGDIVYFHQTGYQNTIDLISFIYIYYET